MAAEADLGLGNDAELCCTATHYIEQFSVFRGRAPDDLALASNHLHFQAVIRLSAVPPGGDSQAAHR